MKNRSWLDEWPDFEYTTDSLDLYKGKIEKVFIQTKTAIYTVCNKEVTCKIEAPLKVRFKSGKTQTIGHYVAEGVAKCAPEDKFNLATGIKLATARAENDYNEHYFKKLSQYHSVIESFANSVEVLMANCSEQFNHNNKHFIPSITEK